MWRMILLAALSAALLTGCAEEQMAEAPEREPEPETFTGEVEADTDGAPDVEEATEDIPSGGAQSPVYQDLEGVRDDSDDPSGELACQQHRAMVAEFPDEPTPERVGERLEFIASIGGLAEDEDIADLSTTRLANVGTEAEWQQWLDDFAATCERLGY